MNVNFCKCGTVLLEFRVVHDARFRMFFAFFVPFKHNLPKPDVIEFRHLKCSLVMRYTCCTLSAICSVITGGVSSSSFYL